MQRGLSLTRHPRVTVAGDIPVGIDGTQSYAVQGDASHYTTVAKIRAAA